MTGNTTNETNLILTALNSADVQDRRVALTQVEDFLDIIPVTALVDRLRDEDRHRTPSGRLRLGGIGPSRSHPGPVGCGRGFRSGRGRHRAHRFA